MENEQNPQPTEGKKSNTALWIIVVVIVIALAGGVYLVLAQEDDNDKTNTNNSDVVVNVETNSDSSINASPTDNVNSIENANIALNQNANAADNTNTSTNSSVDKSGWETYGNATYNFSMRYPSGLERWESTLSPEVVSQRSDGLVFDTGFQPSGYQGSLFLIRVSTQSLFELTQNNPQEFGQLSDSTFQSGVNTWTELTGAEERYGIEQDGFSFIVEIQNTSSDYNVSVLHEMLSTVEFAQ